MTKIAVLYPELFQCKSKFDRKVNNIVSNMNEFAVVYPADPHDYIVEFFSDDARTTGLSQVTDWKSEKELSHAIVFDDGVEFRDERDWLEEKEINVRWIRTPLTRVVNIKLEPEYQKNRKSAEYEYIGRGSYWGNPYSMFEAGEDREEVIRKYAYDFERDLFPNKKKSEVFKLAGKRLGCYCKPESCHGDVLASFLNQYDDGS